MTVFLPIRGRSETGAATSALTQDPEIAIGMSALAPKLPAQAPIEAVLGWVRDERL